MCFFGSQPYPHNKSSFEDKTKLLWSLFDFNDYFVVSAALLRSFWNIYLKITIFELRGFSISF